MSTPIFKTKKGLIVEILREAILVGDLRPGERLLQSKLASAFDVSPTPVREALLQLEAEGVLAHRPHKGVHVTEAKPEHVQEIYLIRRALEGLATQHAVPNLREGDLHKLRSLQSQIAAFVEEKQIDKTRKANYELHMLIYHAADMPELYRMIRRLWVSFPWDSLYVLPSRAPDVVSEHQRLIDAIEEGNPKLAGRLMIEHLDNAATALRTYAIDNHEATGQKGD